MYTININVNQSIETPKKELIAGQEKTKKEKDEKIALGPEEEDKKRKTKIAVGAAGVASAAATKIVTSTITNRLKWMNATAGTVAEMQAVESFEETMAGVKMLGGAAAAMAGGFLIGGAVGGIAALTSTVATTLISATTERKIIEHNQKWNVISSSARLELLGDATYGRNRRL